MFWTAKKIGFVYLCSKMESNGLFSSPINLISQLVTFESLIIAKLRAETHFTISKLDL
jgi:hypothetical protein